jgi:hypothetical protein
LKCQIKSFFLYGVGNSSGLLPEVAVSQNKHSVWLATPADRPELAQSSGVYGIVSPVQRDSFAM